MTRGSRRDGEGDMTYSPDLETRGAAAMAQSRRDRLAACRSAMLPSVRAHVDSRGDAAWDALLQCNGSKHVDGEIKGAA